MKHIFNWRYAVYAVATINVLILVFGTWMFIVSGVDLLSGFGGGRWVALIGFALVSFVATAVACNPEDSSF